MILELYLFDFAFTHFVCEVQCLEAEFYSWVAYGEGIASVNSSLVGKMSHMFTLAVAANEAIYNLLAVLQATVALASPQATQEAKHVLVPSLPLRFQSPLRLQKTRLHMCGICGLPSQRLEAPR